MSTRKIKVASSRWNAPREYETDVTTWGELKTLLGTEVLNFEGSPMKAILRGQEGQTNTIVAEDTLLPQGDFSLMLIPDKVKSGDKIVYNAGVFKDMKTKLNKLLDFMIEATEKGGEMSFSDTPTATTASDEVSIDEEVEEDATPVVEEIDELVLMARELEKKGR